MCCQGVFNRRKLTRLLIAGAVDDVLPQLTTSGFGEYHDEASRIPAEQFALGCTYSLEITSFGDQVGKALIDAPMAENHAINVYARRYRHLFADFGVFNGKKGQR